MATLMLLPQTGCAAPKTFSTPMNIEAVRTDPDDRGLVVSYIGGSCDSGGHLDVSESPSQVRIGVVIDTPNVVCAGVGLPKTLSVRLAAPLGTRQLETELGGHPTRLIPFPGVDLLIPASRPAGFTTPREQGSTYTDATAQAASSEARADSLQTTLNWSFTYDSSAPTQTADCLHSRGVVTVDQTTAASNSMIGDGAVKVGTRQVGTATAQLYRLTLNGAVQSWALVWPTHTGRLSVGSAIECPGDDILGPDQLVDVATSLVPLK